METKFKTINQKMEIMNTEKTLKEKVIRRISTTYTLKRFKETLKTLSEAKMLTEAEKTTLAMIYNDVYKREMGEELKL